MTNKAKTFWGVVAILVVIGLIWWGVSRDNSGQTYKIGVTSPLTGDAAAYGVPVQNMIKLAVDKINAAGGVNGRPLEAIYENDGCNGKDGATAGQKLINVDKVQMIVGSVCSPAMMGFGPIAEQGKVLVVGTGTSPNITEAGDYIFRYYPSDSLAGVVMAEYAYKIGYRKAAVITEQTDYALGLSGVFKQAFKDAGGTVAVDETYPPGETDFRTLAAKIKKEGVDVVYPAPQTTTAGVLIMKQLREAGITAQFLGTDATTNEGFLKEAGKLAEGMIGTTLFFDAEQDESVKVAVAEYKAKYNEDMPFPSHMAAAYDSIFLLADGIKEVGYNATKIKNWLYSLKGWDGLYKGISFDKNGDPLGHKFMIQKATNGKLETVEIFTP